MKRSRHYYILAGLLILLANAWLSYALSSWSIFGGSAPSFWQSVLTWLAVVPQFPSLLVSKLVADAFDFSALSWAATTAAGSVLIYFPVIYVWSNRKRGALHEGRA
jgi:hypothetical protein